MNLRRFLPHIALVIGAVLFSAGLQTLAFTPPSSAPPTGDAYAPLTTSDVPQGKVAGLDLGAITTKGGAIINTVGGSWHGLIVENGNVGIGTTNPGTKLEVAGDTPIITLRSNTPAIKGSLLAGSSGGLTRVGLFSDGILAFGAGGGTKMTIDSNGNVGIGTTNPSVKLHIQDGNTGFLFKDSGSTSEYTTTFSEDNTGLKIGHNSGSRDIQFQTNSNTKMTIDVGGNVGIGTTNPTQKLDVAGYIKGQTGLCIGSDCRTAWPAVGGGAETDPTVPASVKDGTSWGEISGIPAGFADGVDNVGGGSFQIVSTGWTNRGAPNITALCPAGFILTGGNCEWEDSDYKYSTIHSSPNGNGWKCESTDGSRRARAHAFCHQ